VKHGFGVVWLAAQLLLPALSHAHAVGQVDSRGCHPDRRRGDYHCHTGEYAGLTFNSVADLQSQIDSGKTVEQMRAEQGVDDKGRSIAEEEGGGWLSKIPFFGKRSSEGRDVESGDLIVPQGIEQRLTALEKLHEKGLVTDEEYAAKRKQILGEL
jgi:hypothetical protein